MFASAWGGFNRKDTVSKLNLISTITAVETQSVWFEIEVSNFWLEDLIDISQHIGITTVEGSGRTLTAKVPTCDSIP